MNARRRPYFRKRPKLRKVAGTAVVIALLAGVWLAGYLWFVLTLPSEAGEPDRRTDVIVVLTGGAGRVDRGLSLLADGHADMLFVSGVYRSVDVPELLRVSRHDPQELACCVALGYEARSTLGNAEETARWIARNDVASLRLVTSTYHMPRSLIEFRRRMPDIDIVAHPVRAANREGGWRRWRADAHLLMLEYSKYLVARARAALVPITDR